MIVDFLSLYPSTLSIYQLRFLHGVPHTIKFHSGKFCAITTLFTIPALASGVFLLDPQFVRLIYGGKYHWIQCERQVRCISKHCRRPDMKPMVLLIGYQDEESADGNGSSNLLQQGAVESVRVALFLAVQCIQCLTWLFMYSSSNWLISKIHQGTWWME